MTPMAMVDAPWLERKDWASRKIKDHAGRELVLFWIFSLFWNTASWAAVLLAFDEIMSRAVEDGQYLVLAVWVFPLDERSSCSTLSISPCAGVASAPPSCFWRRCPG